MQHIAFQIDALGEHVESLCRTLTHLRELLESGQAPAQAPAREDEAFLIAYV